LKLLFLAQIEEESPEQKKIAFLVEKKRLKEALFATLETHFFCIPIAIGMKRKAGNSS